MIKTSNVKDDKLYFQELKKRKVEYISSKYEY
jgi:hypothetical protein